MTLKDPAFFGEAMSSTFSIGLLGKLFQVLSLQSFPENITYDLDMMTLQSGLKKRVTLSQCLKTFFFICCGFAFLLSLC